MKIYVPSRDRWGETNKKMHNTWKNIPSSWKQHTTYVVPISQVDKYKASGVTNVIAPPDSVDRIAPTRQWIIEHHVATCGERDDKLVMFDDDLTFFGRTTEKIFSIDDVSVSFMLDNLSEMLNDYAHAGILMRLGANRVETTELIYNTRVARAIAFRPSVLVKHGIKFGEVPVQDDFHMTLSLMEKGYPNAVITKWCQEQINSGAPGGASTYRSIEFHNESVKTIKRLHPDFIRIAEKHTKVAWGGQSRLDVVVSWKKAIAHGIKTYGEQRP